MEAVVRFLSEPILGGVGLVLTIVFGLLSYFFYRRQLTIRQPRFFVDDAVRRRSSVQGVPGDVVYEVVVWNGGRGAISALDLVDLDPLRIEAPAGAKFKWVRTLSQRKAANDVAISLSDDKRSGRIRLGFLNWRDGAAFEVCVDGESLRKGSDDRPPAINGDGPRVVGSILGVDRIKQVEKLKYVDEVMIGAVLGFVGLSILIAFAFSIFVVLAFQVGVEFLSYLAPMLLLAVIVCLACAGYYYFFYQDVPSSSERSNWVKLNESERRVALLGAMEIVGPEK